MPKLARRRSRIQMGAPGYLPRPELAALLMGIALIVAPTVRVAGAPPPAYSKEHLITIDATALHPPTRWHVPGVTPIIWSLDPESTEAFETTAPQEVKLKPGSYRFGTFTFDFAFVVTLDGALDFAHSLDECVSGRGTQKLIIRCSRTQPFGGQRDYQY
jgi:hypothetical protein